MATPMCCAQLDKLTYAHSSFFTTRPAEELAAQLIAHAPPGTSNVVFCSSGSEAIEACLKMARHYFVEVGEPRRSKFIARRQSYHGITLGALSVGGRATARAPFIDMLVDVGHVSPCYAYRERGADETDEAYGLRLAGELDAKLRQLGPQNVAAFAETVAGATLGAAPAVPGYFKAIREVCDRHGVLLILDEVMSGMGRTGTLHACDQEGIAPDLMAIAKGLGGGFAPIGALLVSQRIFEAVKRGSGSFPHSLVSSNRTDARIGAKPTWAIRLPAPPHSPASRSSNATISLPMCASRAPTWSAAYAKGSATIITSATCAGTGCSGV